MFHISNPVITLPGDNGCINLGDFRYPKICDEKGLCAKTVTNHLAKHWRIHISHLPEQTQICRLTLERGASNTVWKKAHSCRATWGTAVAKPEIHLTNGLLKMESTEQKAIGMSTKRAFGSFRMMVWGGEKYNPHSEFCKNYNNKIRSRIEDLIRANKIFQEESRKKK